MKKALNILLFILLAVSLALTAYAICSPHSEDATLFDPSVSLNMIWGYILLGLAILSALVCVIYGMVKNPAGIRGTILSVVLIVVVVGVAYFISAGHDVRIPDLETGGYFSHEQAVIAETGILVSYVAGACAVLAAIYSEIANALK